MIIYVTGKSGSGKSTFSKQLAKVLNYNYIDVDEVGHKVYENQTIMNKAYELFGDLINDSFGNFDRKKLGQIVFNERHSERVKSFSDLTWEYMQKDLDELIVDNTVVDWILLPHTKYWKQNALKILLIAKDEDRLQKVIERDGISKEYALLRDKASIEYNESDFDFVFHNKYDSQFAIDCINKVAGTISGKIKR